MLARTAKIVSSAIALVALIATVALVALRLSAERRERLDAETLAPRDGRFVPTAEGRIFTSDVGPRDGAPVVLVHGSGAWGGLWRETAAALAARGYRVLALDLPPFGFSDRPASGDYSRVAQARRIAAFADALKLRDPIVVGHSFGGGPVMEAAMRNPGRFRKVVLVDAALGIGAPPAGLALPLRSQTARELLVAATATNPLLTERLLRQLVHRKDRVTAPYVAVLQRPMSREGSTEAVARWLPHLLSRDPAALSGRAENYARFAGRLEIIWGAADTVTPIDQAYRLRGLVRDARLSTLPETGHIPQIERPELFRSVIYQALASGKRP